MDGPTDQVRRSIEPGRIEPGSIAQGGLAQLRSLLGGITARATPGRAMAALGSVLAVAILSVVVLRPPAAPTPLVLPQVDATASTSTTPTSTTSLQVLTVHVAGAVSHPGVYSLPTGARVTDAVTAAGGAIPGSDPGLLNLAEPVTDGQRIYVPREGEQVSQPGPGSDAGRSGGAEPEGPVDLNTATLAELDSLPGVGPAIGQAILTWRERHGPFTSVSQLLDVPGIGPAKFEALHSLVAAG